MLQLASENKLSSTMSNKIKCKHNHLINLSNHVKIFKIWQKLHPLYWTFGFAPRNIKQALGPTMKAHIILSGLVYACELSSTYK